VAVRRKFFRRSGKTGQNPRQRSGIALPVSTDLCTLRIDWSGVRGSVAELTADDEELDWFFAGNFAHLEELSEEFARRQENWLAERNQWKSQLEHRDALVAELRDDLARVQADLVEALRQLDTASAEPPVSSDIDENLQAEMRRFEEDRFRWEQERVLLENELEMLRGRAAELCESLSEQKQQQSREHAKWTEELSGIRRLVEVLIAARNVPGAPIASAPPPPRSAPSASREDPALQSVMSQFEMLQRDLARRRKQS
jgi:hypothetical protein